MMLTGGCFCGAIRYQPEGTPFHETNCHRPTCGTQPAFVSADFPNDIDCGAQAATCVTSRSAR